MIGVNTVSSRAKDKLFFNHPTSPNPVPTKSCFVFFLSPLFYSPEYADSPFPCAFTRPGFFLSYFNITNCRRPPTSERKICHWTNCVTCKPRAALAPGDLFQVGRSFFFFFFSSSAPTAACQEAISVRLPFIHFNSSSHFCAATA